MNAERAGDAKSETGRGHECPNVERGYETLNRLCGEPKKAKKLRAQNKESSTFGPPQWGPTESTSAKPSELQINRKKYSFIQA